jgi:hypothetical protein
MGKFIAIIFAAALCSVAANSQAADVFYLHPDGPYGETGRWDMTLSEVTPSEWTFTIQADALSAPSTDAVFAEVTVVGVPTAIGGHATTLGVSGSASTNAPWVTSSSDAQFFDLNADSASPLEQNGSNLLSGTFTLASTASPYLDIQAFVGLDPHGGDNWVGSIYAPISMEAPEIDPQSSVGALTLLAGCLLMIARSGSTIEPSTIALKPLR